MSTLNSQTTMTRPSRTGPTAFGGESRSNLPSTLISTKDSAENGSLNRTDSEPELYQGTAWQLMYFQRIMILSIFRLLIFIRKVYEDFQTTKIYGKSGYFGFFIVSSLTLFAPTIVFTLYRICRYLQQALPEMRLRKQQSTRVYASGNDIQVVISGANSRPTSSASNQGASNTRSVKISSTHSLPTTVAGGVQDQHIGGPSRIGNLPASKETRIIIGAGHQIVHGVLYVFWQLKRQVDVIGYLVERACLWRKASQREMCEMEHLRTGSDGLEWFQDFYAAFIAIILQVYSLGVQWTYYGDNVIDQTSRAALLANGQQIPLPPNAQGPTEKGSLLQNTLLQTRIISESSGDLTYLAEIVVSSIAIVSLLIAVRRKDDGPLTVSLSMLGWGCIFASRIIIIALAFVHLGWMITLAILIAHLFIITAWIYKIAIDSHNNKASEKEGFIWVDLEELDKLQDDGPGTTDNWLPIEHVTLITQVLFLFAIPALFYWPIMFNLRIQMRPFKYLVIILIENGLMVLAVLYKIGKIDTTPGHTYLIVATAVFTVVGFIVVSLYVCCKPQLTDYMVHANQLFLGGEQAGIYFELCSRVFKIPDLSSHSFRRLMDQTEEKIEL